MTDDEGRNDERGNDVVPADATNDAVLNDATKDGVLNDATNDVVPAATKDDVLDQIDRLGVDYEVVPCDPALADTAAFCEAYGFGLDESANAIVVVGKSEPRTYAACLVLANTRLDVNGVVRRRLGARKASFASADETIELTGMRIGGVTPFGLAGRLPIWIDARVMDLDRVIVGGGSRSRKLLVAPAALAALDGAEVVADLAKPLDPPT